MVRRCSPLACVPSRLSARAGSLTALSTATPGTSTRPLLLRTLHSPGAVPSSLSSRLVGDPLVLEKHGLLRTATLRHQHAPNVMSRSVKTPCASLSSSSTSFPSFSTKFWKLASIGTFSATVVCGGAWFFRNRLFGEKELALEDDYAARIEESSLTPEQATKELRKNEESYLVNKGRGVFRFDTVRVPCNNPDEDDHAEGVIKAPATHGVGDGAEGSDWLFWSVFDGHTGCATSRMLSYILIPYVAFGLKEAFNAAAADSTLKVPTSEMIDEAIKGGFTKVDNLFIHETASGALKDLSGAENALRVALSGSCALLAFYEPQSEMLRVATTGDCRAVLGRKGQNGEWAAIQLSEDQTGSNEAEASRIRAEHPGGDDVIKRGRVLGWLQPTRAFGDAFYKWSNESLSELRGHFWDQDTNSVVKPPPYVTAEPVVTTTKIEPENGDFLIIATDGLWNNLKNEEAVGLVGRWMEEQKGGKRDQQEDRFVCEDKNAATHLARNALNAHGMLRYTLSLHGPEARLFRDDLTVEVIFFGEGGKSGDVTVNEEATAKEEEKEPNPGEGDKGRDMIVDKVSTGGKEGKESEAEPKP